MIQGREPCKIPTHAFYYCLFVLINYVPPTSKMENLDEELDYAYSGKKDHQLKVVLLGDSGTGKTALATRISQSSFGDKYEETIGVDFYLSRLELPGKIYGHVMHNKRCNALVYSIRHLEVFQLMIYLTKQSA